ncbi:MAG: O-acetyl-ADP-ribose deacetylase [Acidimicrobiia bacterium]
MTEDKTGQGTSLQAQMGDITKIEVDALVNAANTSLIGGGGVDGAIHREGGDSIRSECQEIVAAQGPLEVGQAVITGAGRLPARYVIHTVGPIWHEVAPEEGTRLLASCYSESLGLAVANDCETVAFPCISTGAYGFPIGLAATTAIRTVQKWVAARPGELSEVLFVCFDSSNLHLYRAGLRSE